MQYELPIFENLCPSWATVTHLGTRRRIPKGTAILGVGQTVDAVYFLEEGVIETLLATHAGPEKVLYRLGPGCVFGEVCCFAQGANHEVLVTARTRCTVHVFARETVEGLITREHPGLLLELVALLGHIVRMYGIHLQDSLNLDFFQRTCRFLVYLARVKGADPGARNLQAAVESGVTQNDVARLLGVHRVTVSKAVRRLKDLGIIRQFTRRELEILDFPRLLELAGAGE